MDFYSMADEIKNQMIAIRRTLHQNPELSFCEYETAKFVAKILEDAGIEVSTGIAGTGVVGLLKGKQPGKTIALRADMDALPIEEQTGLDCTSLHPGIMHACGHDMHTSVLLGAAILLSKCRDQLRGNIKFIFQPAEEIGAGASKMIEEGVLENPTVDAIMGLHCWPELPAGTIGVRKGAFMAAADSIEISILGKGGHAAHPHKCVDPIIIAGHVLTTLQTIISRETAPVDSAVITIGKIQGGTASNVIAAQTELSGTVRTVNPDLRKRMPDMIKRIVGRTAESMNGDSSVTYKFGTPPLLNDNHIVDVVGNVVTDILGEERLVYLEYPSMGGEDFAFYLEKVPGMMFRLGTSNEKNESKLPLHNSRLIFDEDAMVTGMAVMCESAIRLLEE